MQAIRVHDGAIRIVEVAMWGPAIRAGRAWHVTFTVVYCLEPESSFDEDGELLVGESTHEFRIRDEKRGTILLAREQPGFGLRAGDMAGDTFVGKLVCSDGGLALILCKRLHHDITRQTTGSRCHCRQVRHSLFQRRAGADGELC